MIERRRRLVALLSSAIVAIGLLVAGIVRDNPDTSKPDNSTPTTETETTSSAAEALGKLAVKGRAAKTGYSRSQFGNGWADAGACDMRNVILARDMQDVRTISEQDCTVVSGTLIDPYTAQTIVFARGASTSDDVQIDHVIALSDAWQKGAQQLSAQERRLFANDPLNLLAVEGKANNNKSDSDAASWLPPNKAYRCRYVARQIAVKQKYALWVTQAEQSAMSQVLQTCPNQQLPVVPVPDAS